MPEFLNLSCGIEDLLLEVRSHSKPPTTKLGKGIPGKLIYSSNTFWSVRWQSNAFLIRRFDDIKHAHDLKLTSDFGIAVGHYCSNAYWTLTGSSRQLVNRASAGPNDIAFPQFDAQGKLVIKDGLTAPLSFEDTVLNSLCLGFSKLQRGSFEIKGDRISAIRSDGRKITGEIIDTDRSRPKTIRYQISDIKSNAYHLIDYGYNVDSTSEIPNHVRHKQIIPGMATNEEELVIHWIKTTRQEQPQARFEPKSFLLANDNVRTFVVSTNDIRMFEDRTGKLHTVGPAKIRRH